MEAPLAVDAMDVPPRTRSTGYPEPFRWRVEGRIKRSLGALFGLRNFGVNLTTLLPGAESALMHRHSLQDEFVYIVAGEATLVTDRGEAVLKVGMCAGFPAAGHAHHLVNRSAADVAYLEIGDRTPSDVGTFPIDDLLAQLDVAGCWIFAHKDGSPY